MTSSSTTKIKPLDLLRDSEPLKFCSLIRQWQGKPRALPLASADETKARSSICFKRPRFTCLKAPGVLMYAEARTGAHSKSRDYGCGHTGITIAPYDTDESPGLAIARRNDEGRRNRG